MVENEGVEPLGARPSILCPKFYRFLRGTFSIYKNKNGGSGETRTHSEELTSTQILSLPTLPFVYTPIGASGRTRTYTGISPLPVLSGASLPFDHRGMVQPRGIEPRYLALQASVMTTSTKVAYGP